MCKYGLLYYKYILYFYIFLLIKYYYIHLCPCKCSRRQDTSFLPEMFVPVRVVVVAPTQRPNPTEARPGHEDQPPRLRRPLARRPDSARPPPRTSPSMILGGVCPLGAMGPQHTPALVHNTLKPQVISRRRAFRKAAHMFASPAARKRTCSPRARSRTTTRDKHYSYTAGLWLVLPRGSQEYSHILNLVCVYT
jgi:hypothetical protein